MFDDKKIIEYVVMNPSGNITILVMSDVEDEEEYYFVAKKLLELEPAAEQVGFLQYDDESEFAAVTTTGSEKTSEEVLFAALEAIDTTPLYIVPVAGSAVPKITKTKPNAGIYAKVVKFYTVPNGEPGVKYQIISL